MGTVACLTIIRHIWFSHNWLANIFLKVLKEIQGVIQELSHTRVVEDDVLKKLTISEEQEILDICEKHKVFIERNQKS